MAAKPYFKFYFGDYLADTMHLSTREHGAYLLLIAAYFHTQSPLPDDNKRLSNIVKVSPKVWGQMRLTLSKMFVIKDGFWYHNIIEKELKGESGK